MKRLSLPTWIFMALIAASAVVLLKYVNLTPKVDNGFFFASTDPQFQQERVISRWFKRKDNLLIINATGHIGTPGYEQKVRSLSDAILKLKGVGTVESITQGPHGLKNAMKGPLWERLLISKDRKSTNIVVFLDPSMTEAVMGQIEGLVSQYSGQEFHLTMSGPSYIVELISRYLLKDIRVFSLLVLAVFGIVILYIFRSGLILLGTITTCLGASIWSLMAVHLLGIRIGLMTANLATIVFVLTLSHIIFLTYNWKFICSQKDAPSSPVKEAMDLTFSPSFWSMMTALLGFFSLLSVPARPLRELGASGIVGALVAITAAYGVYPAFLRLVDPAIAEHNGLDRYQAKMGQFLEKKKDSVGMVLFALFVVALPGLWQANTDPSLLSYFARHSKIEHDLKTIDTQGGSSPLILIVCRSDGEKLDTRDSYEKLWKLQHDLEQNKNIGTIISLPVLMAQARRHFLAALLPLDWLLDILQAPKFHSIADSFVTEDRRKGLFLLRMNESGRTVSRLKIIGTIKSTVQADGFALELVGGIYSLQGHLSKLVASSIVFGLGQLIAVFTLIAWVVSRQIRTSLAVALSICVIPVIVLGTIGWMRVPLDIISAPASNIAIGLGIDSMIHMVRAYRRQRRENQDTDAWKAIRQRFWQPVMTFTLVMFLGFGIFAFSSFPSTQRFGMAVVFGALIASMTSLFVMPAAAQFKPK